MELKRRAKAYWDEKAEEIKEWIWAPFRMWAVDAYAAFDGFWAKIKGKIRGFLEEQWTAIQAWMDEKIEAVKAKFTGIKDAIKNAFSFTLSRSPSILDMVSSGLRQTEDLFGAAAVNITQTLRPAMKQGLGEMVGPAARAVPVADFLGNVWYDIKIGARKEEAVHKSGNGMKPRSSQKAQIWGLVRGPLCSLRALWDGVRVRLGGALAALEGRLLSSERQRQGFLKTVLPAAFFMMMRGLPLWRPAPTVAFPSVRARTIASCSVRLSIIPWSRPPALMATWASSVPSIDRERSIFCCKP